MAGYDNKNNNNMMNFDNNREMYQLK